MADVASPNLNRVPQDHDSRVIRVFISSTFRDMHAERDHLVTVVFPELRERLERLGLEFFDVDLRWGVPETGIDGEKANSWAYCKQWIDRVEPFFVCMLGERYGWVPKPHEILHEHDRELWKGRSVTDMEVRHAVLSERVHRRSMFYLRDSFVPPPPATSPEIYSEFVDTEPVSVRNLTDLKRDIRGSGRPVRPYTCRFTGKEFTELDDFGNLVLEDLWSGVLRDDRFVSKDAWRHVLGHDPDADPLYADELQPIPRGLWEKLVELARPAPLTPLEAERRQMDAFAQTRLRWFQGRTSELASLRDFINGDASSDQSPRLCVVAAVPGQGKSALLAKLSRSLDDSPHCVITHFVGASERSADARSLLLRLIQELDASGIAWPAEENPTEDFDGLRVRLLKRLGDYKGEQCIVVEYLKEYCKELDSPHVDAICQLEQAKNPLYLLVLLGELRTLGGNEMNKIVPMRIRNLEQDFPDTTHLFDWAIDRTRKAFGDEPVRLWFTYLALGRVGMSSRELVDLLKLKLGDEGAKTALRIERSIRRYLQPRGQQLDFFHGQLRQAIEQRYTANAAAREPAHVTLASYFWDTADPGRETKWACDAPRPFTELPYHLERSGTRMVEPFVQIMEDLFFLEAKNRHGLIFDVPADFEGARRVCGDVHPRSKTLDLLSRALRRDLHFIHRHRENYPQGLFQQMCNHAWWYDHPDAEPHYVEPEAGWNPDNAPWRRGGTSLHTLINHWRRQRESRAEGFAWVRSLRPPPVALDSPLRAVLRGHEDRVTHVAFSPDGTRIVSGSSDHAVRVWDARSGLELAVLRGHKGYVTSVSFSPDGVRIVSAGSTDNAVRVWDAQSGLELAVLRGHEGVVFSVAFSPDGTRIVSGSWDHTVRVWDAESGVELAILRGHEKGVARVAFAPDGAHIASGSGDKTVRVWDAERCVERAILRGHEHPVTQVAFSSDGTRIVSAGSSGKTIRVWDAQSGVRLAVLRGHEGGVTGVTFAPDGTRIVSGSDDKTVRVWDAESGVERDILRGHEARVTNVAFSPDGTRIVSGSSDNTIRVWDAQCGVEGAVLRGHEGVVFSVAFAPDGARIASGSGDKTVRVWDAETCVERTNLRGHEDPVTQVAFSPDGARIVSGSDDKTVRVWDARSSVALAMLRGHESGIDRVAFSPDGTRIVSGSWDMTFRVWDAQSGVELAMLRGNARGLEKVAFSPDGTRIVSASFGEGVRVWDMERQRVVILGEEGDPNADQVVDAMNCGTPWCAFLQATTETLWQNPTTQEFLATSPGNLSLAADAGHRYAGKADRHVLLVALEGKSTDGSARTSERGAGGPFSWDALFERYPSESFDEAAHRVQRAFGPTALALNSQALAHRKAGEPNTAEDKLRQAIEIEDRNLPLSHPKRAHRRNNLAMVLLCAGKLGEALQFNAEAWRLKSTVSEGGHDLTSGRILFVRVALARLRAQNAGLFLGQLKTLLGRMELPCHGSIDSTWDDTDVITRLRLEMSLADADLIAKLAEVLNDRSQLSTLDAFPAWRDQPPVPLETPWPPVA